MRLVFAALIWIAVTGGLQWYMTELKAAAPEAPAIFRQAAAEASYDLEITPTFSAEADPFALNTGPEKDPGLSVRLSGVEVLHDPGGAPGETVVLRDVPGLKAGLNEFHVSASPPPDVPPGGAAVRVRLLRDGLPVAETTFWNDAGTVSGTFRVTLEQEKEEARADS